MQTLPEMKFMQVKRRAFAYTMPRYSATCKVCEWHIEGDTYDTVEKAIEHNAFENCNPSVCDVCGNDCVSTRAHEHHPRCNFCAELMEQDVDDETLFECNQCEIQLKVRMQ